MSQAPAQIVTRPRLLFRPDPVIGWSLTPGYAVSVGFREGVVQHVGADGWRHVPGAAAQGSGPRLGLYGCSFTFGTGLADDETFAAGLQTDLPGLRVVNRGIGGHGTVQNYLQFRRDIAGGAVDAAVFAVIGDHRFRNIPHPRRMRQYLSPDWYKLGVEHVPVVRLTASGRTELYYTPIWQPALQRADVSPFLPDDYMITLATLAVFEDVQALAARHDIPLLIVLLDRLSPDFNAALAARFPGTLDISLPHTADYRFLPRDEHPNVAAARIYADRLAPAVRTLCAGLTRGRP